MFLKKTIPSILVKIPLLNCGLIVSLGLATLNAAPLLASHPENLELSQGQLTTQATAVKQSSTPQSNSPLSDGIYLYGQSDQPEQLGQEYLVFKVYQGKVVGAFYLPQSEFNCFYGTLNARSMNLSIVDPYDKTTSSYSIALRELSPVAAGSRTSRAIGLEGYQNIQTLSENDQQILDVCLKEYQ